MKIYKTNAALGYDQYAYLIKLKKLSGQLGWQCLCIGTMNCGDDDSYVMGEVVEQIEDFYLEGCDDCSIMDFSLYHTFLFKHFLMNYTEVE